MPVLHFQQLEGIQVRAGLLSRPDLNVCGLFFVYSRAVSSPAYPAGPLTVSTSSLDSFLPSPVQMAPLSAQSVVTGRVIVT